MESLLNIKYIRWSLLTPYTFSKIYIAGRPNVSDHSVRSRRKNVPSVTWVSILEMSSDITHVSSSLSNELLVVFCIHRSMWVWQRETGVKWNFSISPISVFRFKVTNKMFRIKSRSIFTSRISSLLVNLKLAPSATKLCIYCFFILSSNLFGLLSCFLINSSRALFPISVTWIINEVVSLLAILPDSMLNKVD